MIPLVGMVIGFAEMKLSAKMQARVGPYFAGGRWGWAQLIADGVKFFQKEDLIPAEADRPVFKLAPVLVLVSTVALLVVIPFGPGLIFRDLSVGVFYALAISSLSTIGILMAGWSSANKYSLMGGLRAAGQLIAYELPLVLAVVGAVILAGTMSMTGIVEAQISSGYPYVIFQFIGFGIFMVAFGGPTVAEQPYYLCHRFPSFSGNRIYPSQAAMKLSGRSRSPGAVDA
jgi:NADH-quinone oxidoreductase subunit H